MSKCNRCEDGITAVPNGPDDSDIEFCDCPRGQARKFLLWYHQKKSEVADKMRVIEY